jgi:hypothetical protein
MELIKRKEKVFNICNNLTINVQQLQQNIDKGQKHFEDEIRAGNEKADRVA